MSFFVSKEKGSSYYAKNKSSKCRIYGNNGILHGVLYDRLYHFYEVRSTFLQSICAGNAGNVGRVCCCMLKMESSSLNTRMITGTLRYPSFSAAYFLL